ncbi:DNA polymerase Y family protein, partial [Amycolatopsis sp. SID8362]|nr:DNA polymerase Y family protein [Amycolatopsis sp. SID8362]NED48194.1 DNA polymerase Y family protein [Amycolatopsis sp. SID8362]
PVPAAVVDAAGTAVRCTARGELSHPPTTVSVDDGPPRRVLGAAGPWIVHQRGARLARVQVVLETDDGDVALLLRVTIGDDPQWTVEGCYD